MMSSARRILAVVIVFIATSTPLAAQAPADGDAGVRAAIEQLFDGMRTGDSTAVRAVFHPEARMLTAAVRNGETLLQAGSIDEFVQAVGTPHPEVWDERIDDLEIEVDDPLATAWMDYRFHLGETFSHCGVNAFQFLRTAEGWRVIQITDTRRRDCSQ
jgi:hypothetical protein